MGKAGSPEKKRGASVMSWWRHVRKWFANAGIRILNPRVCCVPSLRHLDTVPDFARRLAAKLGLPFIDAIEKSWTIHRRKCSKTVFTSVKISTGVCDYPSFDAGPALLVDDIVDSAWTLTVLTALLRQCRLPDGLSSCPCFYLGKIDESFSQCKQLSC